MTTMTEFERRTYLRRLAVKARAIVAIADQPRLVDNPEAQDVCLSYVIRDLLIVAWPVLKDGVRRGVIEWFIERTREWVGVCVVCGEHPRRQGGDLLCEGCGKWVDEQIAEVGLDDDGPVEFASGYPIHPVDPRD